MPSTGSSRVKGFGMCPFIPAARLRSSSSFITLAVLAMMAMRDYPPSIAWMAFIAS